MAHCHLTALNCSRADGIHSDSGDSLSCALGLATPTALMVGAELVLKRHPDPHGEALQLMKDIKCAGL